MKAVTGVLSLLPLNTDENKVLNVNVRRKNGATVRKEGSPVVVVGGILKDIIHFGVIDCPYFNT